MADSDYARVVGDEGLRGVVLGPSDTTADEIAIELDDGREISVPSSSLERRQDGTWYLRGTPSAGTVARSDADTVVPVIAEELNVSKRKVETGRVRVGKSIVGHDEKIAMPLARERAEVKRVLIDREVSGPQPIRREGDTIIMPVVEEVPVVTKRLILKEEIHVTRHRSVEHHEETVTVHREEAEVAKYDEAGRRILEPPAAEPAPVRPRKVAAPPKQVTTEPAVDRRRTVLPEDQRSVLDPTKPRPRFIKPTKRTTK